MRRRWPATWRRSGTACRRTAASPSGWSAGWPGWSGRLTSARPRSSRATCTGSRPDERAPKSEVGRGGTASDPSAAGHCVRQGFAQGCRLKTWGCGPAWAVAQRGSRGQAGAVGSSAARVAGGNRKSKIRNPKWAGAAGILRRMVEPQGSEGPITPRAVDYAQWYQDALAAADLVDQAPVRGCWILRPNGYLIWELCQRDLD